jgi:glutaminyl-peptide cyclotransferase
MRRQIFRAQVLARQDTEPVFSQGLQADGGSLMESTRTSLRLLDAGTGAVLRQVDLPKPLFGTGVAHVPADQRGSATVWQLTWKDRVAIQRNPVTLAEQRRAELDGEGWGLCYDGTRLVQSEGTNRLVFRDARTFTAVGELRVADRQWGGTRLGELECVHADGRPQAWASVWGTDWMVRIDLDGGTVTAVTDLSPVTVEEHPIGVGDVIGGITAVPDEPDQFWLTGKNYRHRYKVRLQQQP